MISLELLNVLNEMSLMLVLAKKGEWEAFQRLEQGWKNRFHKAFKKIESQLSDQEKQQMLAELVIQIEQIESLVESQASRLRQSYQQDKARQQKIQRYLKTSLP